MADEEKNPYTLRRNIGAAATLISLAAYFIVPAEQSVARLVLLIIFFVLVTVCTYFQSQYRSWVVERRSPDDYDEDGRLKKYSKKK